MNNFSSTILECPICFDYYNDPRILTNCGHTLCTNCIIDIISTNTEKIDSYLYIDCPTCSETTKIENADISSLKINYTVSSIIDSLKKKKIENTSISTSCPESIVVLEETELIYTESAKKINNILKNKFSQKKDIPPMSKAIDIPSMSNAIDIPPMPKAIDISAMPKSRDISPMLSSGDIPNNMNSEMDNIIFDMEDDKPHRRGCCNLLDGPFSAPK